jgi:hypothetical protein
MEGRLPSNIIELVALFKYFLNVPGPTGCEMPNVCVSGTEYVGLVVHLAFTT